jgi:glycosyltransferase involved in cell wall biosynthesis
MIEMPGYSPHSQSIEAISTADLLFLPLHALPGGQRSRIVPGKTYEYLASGRPILAAVPDGDAADFVRDAGAGAVVGPTDVAAILNAIVQAHENPAPTRTIDSSVERFDRLQLATQLSHFLSSVAGARRVAS